tara:strand:+ start:12390 stop:12887 length:498 start_codon:yes stop_codon:yes gene_type:complete
MTSYNINLVYYKNYIFQKLRYIVLVIPSLFVYLPTLLFPVTQNIGSEISFRPPGYVFAIVWPILLVLLGISWFSSLQVIYLVNIKYLILVTLLGIWFILYNFNKVIGLIDIILALLTSLYLLSINVYKSNRIGYLTIIPLIIWLNFASILNIASILIVNEYENIQ